MMPPRLKALWITSLSMPFSAILWLVTFAVGARAHEIALSFGYRGDSAQAAAVLAGTGMFASLLAFGVAVAFCFALEPERETNQKQDEHE